MVFEPQTSGSEERIAISSNHFFTVYSTVITWTDPDTKPFIFSWKSDLKNALWLAGSSQLKSLQIS